MKTTSTHSSHSIHRLLNYPNPLKKKTMNKGTMLYNFAMNLRQLEQPLSFASRAATDVWTQTRRICSIDRISSAWSWNKGINTVVMEKKYVIWTIRNWARQETANQKQTKKSLAGCLFGWLADCLFAWLIICNSKIHYMLRWRLNIFLNKQASGWLFVWLHDHMQKQNSLYFQITTI